MDRQDGKPRIPIRIIRDEPRKLIVASSKDRVTPIIPNDGSVKEVEVDGITYRFRFGFGQEVQNGRLVAGDLPDNEPRLAVVDDLRLSAVDGSYIYHGIPVMIAHGGESISSVTDDLYSASWQIHDQPVAKWLKALDKVTQENQLPPIALLATCMKLDFLQENI